MGGRVAVLAALLSGIVLVGCATGGHTPVEIPRAGAVDVEVDAQQSCALSPEESALLNARWRTHKRRQTSHVGSWTLDQLDVAEMVKLAEGPERKRALQRLYDGRFGNTVFLRDGLLTGAGVRAHTVFAENDEVEAQAERVGELEKLEARVRELRGRVEEHVERPLSDRDLARICARVTEAHVTPQLELDVLTVESLRSLAELDDIQSDLRRAVGVFDAALVLASWRFAAVVDGPEAGDERYQMPTWLHSAASRTGDVEALSKAVYAALKYDGFKKPYDDVAPIIRKAIRVAEDAGIDPFIVVTVIFMESRFRPEAIGDGGKACGLGQQHADFSMKWGLSDTLSRFEEVRIAEARRQRQFNYECNLLKDPDYALKVLVHLLNKIKSRAPNLRVSVCRYNEGPFAPCEGRGLFYLRKHEWWRELIRVAYDRILTKQLQEREAAREEGASPTGDG